MYSDIHLFMIYLLRVQRKYFIEIFYRNFFFRIFRKSWRRSHLNLHNSTLPVSKNSLLNNNCFQFNGLSKPYTRKIRRPFKTLMKLENVSTANINIILIWNLQNIRSTIYSDVMWDVETWINKRFIICMRSL